MTQLNAFQQRPVQRNEHWDLYQDRKTATHRVDLLFAVHLHHRFVQLLAVIAIPLFQRLQARTQLAHLCHRAVAGFRQLVEHQLDEDRKQDDGHTPISNKAMQLLEQPVQRLGNEPEVTKIINKHVTPGMTVLDIGANTGGHTLMFAKNVGPSGRVYAFEPMSEAVRRLERNIELNHFENIIVEHKGLSDVEHVEKAYFTFYGPMDGVQPEHVKEDVNFIKLDDYVEQIGINSIDFVKIDVDGYEYKVLKGGIQTFCKYMPMMIIEIGFGYQERFGGNLDFLLNLLCSFGYNFYSEKLELLKNKKEILNYLPKEGATNVICIGG